MINKRLSNLLNFRKINKTAFRFPTEPLLKEVSFFTTRRGAPGIWGDMNFGIKRGNRRIFGTLMGEQKNSIDHIHLEKKLKGQNINFISEKCNMIRSSLPGHYLLLIHARIIIRGLCFLIISIPYISKLVTFWNSLTY